MTTFVCIICGFIIGWLLMLNHDIERNLRQVEEELTEARRLNIDLRHALAESDALLAEGAKELAIVSNMLMTQKTGAPFGDNYVRPYSLLTKN